MFIKSALTAARTIAGASALVLLVAGQAAASETKTYMGAFCVPGGSGFDTDRLSVTNGELKASDRADAECPIVKSVTNNSALENVTLNVTVGSTASMQCDLYAYHAIATSSSEHYTNIAAHMRKVVTGTGNKTISFGTAAAPFAAGLGAPWANDFLYYQISCTLNAGDRIRNYQVQEAGTRNEYSKIYSPAMCRPDLHNSSAKYFYQPGTAADEGGPYVFAGGWFMSGENYPGDTYDIVCPVIADHMGNTKATAVASIAVGGSVGDGVITCSLYASDNFGFPVDSHGSGAIGPAYPTQTMDIDLGYSVPWARYHINCTMPGTGDERILGYRISEN